MATFMRPYATQSYALLRIVTGFLLLWHGAQKLLSIPTPPPPQLPSFVIAIAGPIELIGGTLVMIGLFTGWAAFLCSGLMAFAYWMGHGTNAPLPIQNMGELAALYCFVFLYISTQGSGIWSVDVARKQTGRHQNAGLLRDTPTRSSDRSSRMMAGVVSETVSAACGGLFCPVSPPFSPVAFHG